MRKWLILPWPEYFSIWILIVKNLKKKAKLLTQMMWCRLTWDLTDCHYFISLFVQLSSFTPLIPDTPLCNLQKERRNWILWTFCVINFLNKNLIYGDKVVTFYNLDFIINDYPFSSLKRIQFWLWWHQVSECCVVLE